MMMSNEMYLVENMQGSLIMSEDCENMLQYMEINCRETTYIIRNHQIPHFLLRSSGGHHLYLVINDNDAAFARLCGLIIDSDRFDNKDCVPEHINCLFEK